MASMLGGSGAGAKHTLKDGRVLTFTGYTQGVMDDYEAWLVEKITKRAQSTSDAYRARAAAKWREVRQLRQSVEHLDGNTVQTEERLRVQEEWERLAGDAQQMEMEAREVVYRTNDRVVAGYYHFYSQLAGESKRNLPGQEQLAWLCLRKHHPQISLEDVRSIDDTEWAAVMRTIAVAAGEVEPEKNDNPSGGATQPPETKTSASSPGIPAAASGSGSGTA